MKKGRVWYAVDVETEPDAEEAVESAFNAAGAIGTEIDGLRNKSGETLRVTGFFESPPDEADIRAFIAESIRIYGLPSGSLYSYGDRIVE